jgi:hypothetical protein
MATPPLQTYGKCFESVESYSGAESKPEEADPQRNPHKYWILYMWTRWH